MRKASSVMKKTLIPGGTTTAAKPSSPAPAPTTSSNRFADTQHDSNQHLPEESSSIHDSEKHRLAKKVPALPDTSDGDQSSQQESATELGVDFPILPSTSTFTLGGRDDRGEKLKKKAKNFLDERQKTKSRAQSLWSYIDATNTLDQARFFQENAEQIFHVVYETCMHHIEKIKQKSERPQSWSSKELVSLQKNLLLLRKMFLYVPELMRNGWQRKNIAKLLKHILDHGNHLRLRALGFHLLLLWLNDQVVEYPECMELFANAISLDLFILDDVQPISSNTFNTSSENPNPPEEISSSRSHGLHFVRKLGEKNTERAYGQGLTRDSRIKMSPLKLYQTLIFGDDQAPLYPNPVQPTYNDSIVLLHIFLSNLVRLAYVAAGSPPPPDDYEYPPGDHFEADDGIATGVGIDAATASAKFLFRIFRTYYLTKFTPQIAKAFQMEGIPSKDEDFGFPTCPPSILRTVLRFLIGYCLDNNERHHTTHWPNMPTASASSPATPILKSIVLSSYETREMLHEMLRQALLLPCTNSSYRDITRGAIHILGVWILGNEDERPSFLRRTGSWTAIPGSITRSSSLASVPTTAAKADNGTVSTSSSIHDEHDYKHADANRFLRRYFLMIRVVFENHWKRAMEQGFDIQGVDWDGVVSLYKDAINVYRAITVTRGGIDMECESWELLLQCLLDIQTWFMSPPDKCVCIPVPHLAEDLADYICETLLHAFSRANLSNMDLWKDLRAQMVATMAWTSTLGQWVKIMHKITRLLSSRLYKVDYECQPLEHVTDESSRAIQYHSTYGNRPRNKVRSRHLSIQADLRSNKRSTARPLSSGGSDGQLFDTVAAQDKVYTTDNTTSSKTTEHPNAESSASNAVMIMRNLSNLSLSEKASSSKTSDRRSAHFVDIDENQGMSFSGIDEEANGSSSSSSHGRSGGNNIKFGIKNIIPAPSFSSSTAPATSPTGPPPMISTTQANSGSSSIGSGSQKRGNNTRRTVSIHQFDTLWQDSSSKLLNFVHHGQQQQHGDPSESNPRPTTLSAYAKDEDDRKSRHDMDRKSIASSIDRLAVEDSGTVSSKSIRSSISTIMPQGEMIALTTSVVAVNEKLPSALGIFRSNEFLNLSSMVADGMAILEIWKNMLCSIGNINQLEDPQNHAVAMSCVVEIWDTLSWVRSRQPFQNVTRPALYEMAPWFLQATELSENYDIGRAAAYGCLCRLVSQRPEEKVSISYYAHFYRAILKGLSSKDTAITESIMCNSGRIFSRSLPGVYILIPPFIDGIENMLLEDDTAKDVEGNVRRACLTILGSLVPISNHLTDIKISIEETNIDWISGFNERDFAFADIKIWLKNLLLRLVNADTTKEKLERDTDAHCMLLGAICSLTLDELLQCDMPQHDLIYESILAMVNHLYWSNITIVNNVVDCLNTMAQIYTEDIDPDGVIVQEVLTRIIDALNVHLKYYEHNSKDGRGFIISKLFSCLLEWLMVIEPMILSETELCQLVFDVIEYALHTSSEGGPEKLLPHPPLMRSATSKKKELPFKFKLITEKRPALHHEYISVISGSDISASDQGYVKESAEAVLLHLLHHFNNFAPPYGPATIHSTIIGPGVATDDNKEDMPKYQYFSFNDTTIIAFVELPETEEHGPKARMIIRDVTGRYVWDAVANPSKELETSESGKHKIESPSGGKTSDIKEEGFCLRPGVEVQNTITESVDRSSRQMSPDELHELLHKIGEQNPDCATDLNSPIPLSQLQNDMVGRFDEQLSDFLEEEADNNEKQESDVGLWYSKMNILRRNDATDRSDSLHTHLIANFSIRKDFLPAFPHEAEKSHVPFQQSRLLLSHLGFINYEHLKDKTFQMLNKTPALFRDLRLLDRKQGRETMKIAVIYVGPGQEDEQSILHNNHGSTMYNAFVNSLGWEIDIATHTGYLGGLERNLTNGTRTNYYCSSTLEMIFHDVTKMPTEAGDPKQLKKKRHVGNDHVHIVWNEHDRDYRIGTIGGDFGNAQIVVNPLTNGLFAIRVYRDEKIPYFGPLFDRMVVSQATLGPLVRATAINAFRASIHTNYYSFYKTVFAQRANDVKTIANRHKGATWSYEQFMEKIFMPYDE